MIQMELETCKPEPGYTPADRKAKVEGGALSILVDAQGNVTEVKRTLDPLGEGLDESAAATESGGLSCGASRSHRLVAHQFFNGRTIRGWQAACPQGHIPHAARLPNPRAALAI